MRGYAGEPQKPWLIFLHGFSGDSREWQPVGERFTAYSRLYIDLPGHGDSADSMVTSFVSLTMRCSTLFIVTTY
jgi:2-succinyl-6-hydroxy-2,4-cyclohexadiene-1-carboxylate synthase